MRIYCRKVIINNRELLKEEGPLLLAVNHPNSFFDAVILDTLFARPLYSLARGDAFAGRRISRILKALKILPVYRTREGVENLTENYKTFTACRDIFQQKGIVLIFSEGLCINEWHLRPLKKGTARLAFSCWNEQIPLKVLPVAVNYSSFRKFGKNVFIRFGTMIVRQDFDHDKSDGLKHAHFNNLLKAELEKGVFEIEKYDQETKTKWLTVPVPDWKKAALFIPSLAGWIFHAPLYMPLKRVVLHKTKNTDHYDSVMTGLLLLLYPLYLLLISIGLAVWLSPVYAIAAFLLLPFTAWAYVQTARQLD